MLFDFTYTCTIHMYSFIVEEFCPKDVQSSKLNSNAFAPVVRETKIVQDFPYCSFLMGPQRGEPLDLRKLESHSLKMLPTMASYYAYLPNYLSFLYVPASMCTYDAVTGIFSQLALR